MRCAKVAAGLSILPDRSDGPICGEQCKDLLAEVAPAGLPGHVIGFEDGYAAVRRSRRSRPRRGPAQSTRPFDARKAYFADRELPRDKRSVPSLLHELRIMLMSSPESATDPGEHRYEVKATYEELARRGVDTEAVVRFALVDHLVVAICMSATTVPLARTSSDSEDLGSDRWTVLLQAAFERDRKAGHDVKANPVAFLRRVGAVIKDGRGLPSPEPAAPPHEQLAGDQAVDEVMVYGLAGRFAESVQRWVQSADIEDVLNWRAPKLPDGLPSADEVSLIMEPSRADRARWIFERFTMTYPTDWHRNSLHSEWSWLHGRCQGACPADVMQQRGTHAKEIASCIADIHSKAVSDVDEVDTSDGSIVVSKFVVPAAESLRAGRTSDATAIFRALLKIRPNDPEISNNYGFCLIPEDPAVALGWLNRAADLREGADGTNLANRVFACLRLEQYGDVIVLAEQLWQIDDKDLARAYLWLEAEDDSLTLGESVAAKPYVALLAHRAAVAIGHDSEPLWRGRVEAGGEPFHSPAAQ